MLASFISINLIALLLLCSALKTHKSRRILKNPNYRLYLFIATATGLLFFSFLYLVPAYPGHIGIVQWFGLTPILTLILSLSTAPWSRRNK
jgi:hypothetical protein